MGNYSNSEMMLKSKVLPTHAYHPNAAHIGGYVSYDYAGKLKVEEEYQGSSNDEDVSLSDFENYNSFDAGMQVGVGLWFDRFNLDFTYQRGFIGIYDISNFDSPRSSNFMIRLGVAF